MKLRERGSDLAEELSITSEEARAVIQPFLRMAESMARGIEHIDSAKGVLVRGGREVAVDEVIHAAERVGLGLVHHEPVAREVSAAHEVVLAMQMESRGVDGIERAARAVEDLEEVVHRSGWLKLLFGFVESCMVERLNVVFDAVAGVGQVRENLRNRVHVDLGELPLNPLPGSFELIRELGRESVQGVTVVQKLLLKGRTVPAIRLVLVRVHLPIRDGCWNAHPRQDEDKRACGN